MTIPTADIQKLIDLPIEGVAERLGLHVSRHRCLCPFHDDSHPSLTFNVHRNNYCCYACGAKGRNIDLVMNVLRLPFVEACRWLADGTNVIIERYRSRAQPKHLESACCPMQPDQMYQLIANRTLTEEAHHFLFDIRKLDPRVIEWCRLTSTHQDLIIPYFGIDGELRGLQWRYLGTDKDHPRFKFPPGSQCSIYNLPILRRLQPGEPLYIAEGASDCWSLLSSGHKAIAIPSATLLNPNDLQPLLSLSTRLGTTFHMYPDQDEPGERLFQQLSNVFSPHQGGVGGGLIIRHFLPSGCKDYSDYYLKTLNC